MTAVILALVGALWWVVPRSPASAPASAPAPRPSPVRAEPAPAAEPAHPPSAASDDVPANLGRLLAHAPPVDPIPFTTERIPHEYTPAGFEAAVTAAVDSCGTPRTVVDIDCAEAPCVAALVGARQFVPSDCPEWLSTFGDATMTDVSFHVPCPDGRVAKATVVAPHLGVDLSVDEDRRDDVRWRMVERAAQWPADVWCRAGAR